MIFGSKKGTAAQKVPIAKIHGQTFQPRRAADRADLERLVASVRRHGLLSPIVVRPQGSGYELVSGQRRLLACRKLGWTDIPALIRDLDDETALDLSLSENLDRLELSPLEKAESLIYLSRTFPEISAVTLAERFGVDFEFIETGAKLVALPTILKEALMLGILTPPLAIELGRLKDEETMARAIARVHRDQLSVRETARLVDQVISGDDETPPVAVPAIPAAEIDPTNLGIPTAALLDAARAGRPLDLNLLRRVVQTLRLGLQGEPIEFLDLDLGEARIGARVRHAVNVARIALFLGHERRLDEHDLFRLGTAALLADVGLTRIPESILGKKTKLNEGERQRIREHPENGARYLEEEMLLDTAIVRAVAEHHERPDGDGYPAGLEGEKVHPLARLVRVADAYEAMISPRPYKEQLTAAAAVQQLIRGAEHGAFDPGAVDSFVRAFSHYPIGSTVQLEGGLEGMVIRSHADAPDRPIIRVRHPDPEPGTATTEIVDLVEAKGPRIVGPVVQRAK